MKLTNKNDNEIVMATIYRIHDAIEIVIQKAKHFGRKSVTYKEVTQTLLLVESVNCIKII